MSIRILYVTTSHHLRNAFNGHTEGNGKMFFTTPGASLTGAGPFDIIMYEKAAMQTSVDEEWLRIQALTRGSEKAQVLVAD